jgi:hypothetical protein
MVLMAIIAEIDEVEMRKWIKGRPQKIQEMCGRWPPNLLYRDSGSKLRVFIYSYSENGTVTVIVSGRYNFVCFERKVFGVDPEALEECEMPGVDEKVGVMFTGPEEINLLNKRFRKLLNES